MQQEDIQKTVDGLIEALARDERVLSVKERALIVSVIQYATANSTSPEVDKIVMERITNAVESAVAQHILRSVGSIVVQRLLAPQLGPHLDPFSPPLRIPPVPPITPPHLEPVPPITPPHLEPVPPITPPHLEPVPPITPPGAGHPSQPGTPPTTPPPTPPNGEPSTPSSEPTTPSTTPEPDSGGVRGVDHATLVALDGTLAREQVAELVRHTLTHEADFVASSVIEPGATTGIIDFEQRQVRVLRDLGEQQEIIVERIQALLPCVFEQLEFSSFPSSLGEMYLMASSEGDSFRSHQAELDAASSREEITFIYFFHREPKAFTGGELRIHDASIENGRRVASKAFKTIIPQQNQIVFFPSRFVYEILPVYSPSRAFADSHFTLQGEVRK